MAEKIVKEPTNGIKCDGKKPPRLMPGGRDMVRKVLRNLQKAGFVECLGRGPGEVWQKKGNTLKKR